MARTLVPLDGSQLAEEALAWAATLARSRGDSLHLLSVYGWDEQMWEAAQIDPNLLIHGARAQLTSYLNGTSRSPALHGIEVTTEVRAGDVAQEIAKAVGERETSLVVITTHGRGGFDGSGRGSVADKLIRTLAVPVAVIRPHIAVAPVQTVLLPLDGSPDGEAALGPGRALAGQLNAAVHLLSAVDPELTWNFPEPGGAGAQEHLRNRAEAYLNGLRLPHELAVVQAADPANAIADHARLRNCQLIVMATHGRSGPLRLELGSVADDVVRKASCPVLLVPIGRSRA